jgi:hypothetical protein
MNRHSFELKPNVAGRNRHGCDRHHSSLYFAVSANLPPETGIGRLENDSQRI